MQKRNPIEAAALARRKLVLPDGALCKAARVVNHQHKLEYQVEHVRACHIILLKAQASREYKLVE